MNIRNIIFVNLLLVFKLVSTEQNEITDDLKFNKTLLQSDNCNEQMEMLLSRPKLLQKFTEASAYIPRNINTKETLQYPGDPCNCLSIDVDINGTAVQGKYAEVIVEVPTHSDEPPDFETLQNVIKRYEMRKPYRLYFGIGSKINFPRKPQLQYKRTTSVMLGVCIPRPCSTAEAIDIVLDTERRPLIVSDRIIEGKYEEKVHGLPVDKPFTTADYCFTIVSACVILLATVSTVYDVRTDKGSSTADLLYRSFSIHKNARQLLRVSSSKDTVECVDGIRAIAMALIIWLHCYTSTEARTYPQITFSFQQFFRPSAAYSVDSFFLLGGIFNIYSTVSKYTQRSFLTSLHVHVLNRLIRLYPVLCFGILAQASIMNHISDNWPQVENCRKSWWIPLLFIQNIIYNLGPDREYQCLVHTWYLAADMQLFLLSTLVLMWIFGKKKTAWIALSVAVILALASSTILSFLYNFPFNFVGNTDELVDYLITYYSITFSRASPYFIGMMIGYFLYCSKNQRLRSNTKGKKIWAWVLWCLTMLLFVIIFAGFTVWSKVDNQLLHNIMNSYWNTLWSVAVGWLIVACHHGHGGLVNFLLSLTQWKLISRLSYSMYILHLLVVNLVNEKSKSFHGSSAKTDFAVFQNFLCAFFATLVISFVVTLLIEAPVLNLYRLAQDNMKSGRKEDSKNKEAALTVKQLYLNDVVVTITPL